MGSLLDLGKLGRSLGVSWRFPARKMGISQKRWMVHKKQHPMKMDDDLELPLFQDPKRIKNEATPKLIFFVCSMFPHKKPIQLLWYPHGELETSIWDKKIGEYLE